MNEPGKRLTEDWLAVIIGLLIVSLSFLNGAGVDVFGWVVKANVWTRISNVVGPLSARFSWMPGLVSLLLTYLFLLVILGIGIRLLGGSVRRFVVGFTCIFAISYVCLALGHYAHIAATPDKLKGLGISWSLNLTGEAGYIIALLAGLAVGNFFPRMADAWKEAIRPEWYIKTAIVILGAGLGVKSAEALGLAQNLLFRGLCAIVEAYLIYWPIVYLVARKYFKFSREWAAPLASGISICGVSAAIATGAAIRARPIVPVMVSSLVVIFAVMELLLLPFIAQRTLSHEPLVAGAWMGLAVKTDGAAVASGTITDALIRAEALENEGVRYKEGWITMAATNVKVFIDIFIGIWAFVLAVVWSTYIDRREGQSRMRVGEIWDRFPKFILGYVVGFAVLLLLVKNSPDMLALGKKMTAGWDAFRGIFFVLTFFTIGAVSNFRKLWEEGIGRLAAVYILCLFGFIIWVGLFISWVFFHGIKPPIAS